MSTAGGGGVFVSYRRDDSGDVAGRLADRLSDHFGEERVFIDVETIEPGADYAEAITGAVAACAVLVAVIGPGWLTAADGRGRRLDDPGDWVRVEVGTALTRGVRVIPVLVAGAVMPAREDLPDGLAGLARCNALPVRRESFRDDARRLITAVERVLASARAAGSALNAPLAGDASGRTAETGTGVRQDDRSRAALLLGEAARIARSITGESSKAGTLSDVARAVAPTDPGGAEIIARSITNESQKAQALSDVASAVAATDSGRAETIARSITNESFEARTLSVVARAVAPTDPGRAESIARYIPDVYRKAQALSNVARAVAPTDPGRAETIARSIHDGHWKAVALASIANALISA